MAGENDQWELSKENIQPIQQGRKPEVLKAALSTQPEDQTAQQKEAFENELRTYTGDDPLDVWYRYMIWAEQIFPKGGRDGHLHQMIRQCLSQLISRTEYYNDKRFIKIWLKYANTSLKPAEVYENMYSRNIGCGSASFFMAWSWELEQKGNFKKANEIINEGIQRRAEPLDKLKDYRSEFEIRVANKVMSGIEPNNDLEESGRSAFSVLKHQKKKNLAPAVRTGASIMEPNRSSMTLGRQQPMPKNNVPSAKVPFKIYNAENLPSALPIQSENPPPFTLYSDTSKENEKKPSKWNKVRVKQVHSVLRSLEDTNLGFKLHCDDDTQPESTPRSISKVSNILRVCKDPSSPEVALFEKDDPMRRVMYDKVKVYGGGEEFALEEIRAAEWVKKDNERKLERKLQEQQALIKSLEQKVQLLQIEAKKPTPAIYSETGPSQKVNIFTDPSPLKIEKLQKNFHQTSEPHFDYCNQENELDEMDKEDIENVPPKDYVKEDVKRELAGILQPSKNVMFIPLQDQYEEAEPENEEEDLYNENNNHPFSDETLCPPCNTEQFVSEAFIASTPRTQIKRTKYPELQNSFEEKAVDGTDKFSKSPGSDCNVAALQAPLEEIAYSSKQVYKSEGKTSMRDQSTFPGMPGQLSVILETSKECYKSSSSSGSSGSVTRLSQFSQCYSHEKSNIQKHLSKTDVFKEPRPVPHSRDVSNSAARDNSLCANKDIKSVCQTAVEKDIFEIHFTDVDPFDETLRNNYLVSLSKSDRIFGSMHISKKPLKTFKAKDEVEFGGVTYVIADLIAEGAFGKVYEAGKEYSLAQNFDSSNSKVALKACKGATDWEYYICTTLHNRLKETDSLPDVRSSVMELLSACRFSNGIMLVSEFNYQGTLLDLVNMYKKQNHSMPETFAFYLTLEILQMVGKIHECEIVHTDIKPENILVRDNVWSFDVMENLGQKTSVLKLIDFGRAIDLKAFQKGVCFKTILKENCVEMRENKPWVFQLDWYGVLSCIHIVLFSEYMKVKQNKNGRWEIEKRIKRYWDQTIWASLFDELLNIPSCYKEPNIEKFTCMIITKLQKNETPFITYFRRMSNFYSCKTV